MCGDDWLAGLRVVVYRNVYGWSNRVYRKRYSLNTGLVNDVVRSLPGDVHCDVVEDRSKQLRPLPTPDFEQIQVDVIVRGGKEIKSVVKKFSLDRETAGEWA